jgi:hypothetical protein
MVVVNTAGEKHGSQRRGLGWPGVVCLTAVGIILLWAGVISLQAWFHGQYAGEEGRKIVERVSPELQAAVAEQKTVLTGYLYLDRDEDRVRLPIDRAMELVVQESKEAR